MGGCQGDKRYDDGVCQPCSSCGVGEFISGPCVQDADGSFTAPCTACPLCDPGKYLAKPCTGTQQGLPDQASPAATQCHIFLSSNDALFASRAQ